MSVPTIDLGTATHSSREDTRPPLLSSFVSRCWHDRHRRRIVALATVSVLLFALVATAAPATPRLDPLLTVPAGRAALLGDSRLYVVGLAGHDEAATLTAYRLSDGAVLWHAVDTANLGNPAELQVRNGVLLLTGIGAAEALGASAPEVVTTAYDPDNGTVRWRHGGWVGPTGADSLVILLPGARVSPADARQRARPTAVDLDTGAERWTAPAATRLSYRAGPTSDDSYLVTVDDGSRLTAYHVDTGTISGSRSLTDDIADVDPGHLILTATDELVIVTDLRSETSYAYATDTLAHRWTTELLLSGAPAEDCAPVLCLRSPAGVLHGVDPGTGQPRWSVDPAPADGTPAWPRTIGPDAGTLLVRDRLLDAATGELVRFLGRWVHRPDRVLTSTHRQEPVLTWRRRGDDTSGPATWIGRLRAGPPRVEVLGSAGWLDGCAATTDHLACRAAGDLHVWHIRDRPTGQVGAGGSAAGRPLP